MSMHGFIPPDRYYPYLTWPDIAALEDKGNTVLIQPVGAIEQHGPHLPLAVDAALGTAILGQALTQLEASVPAFALPTLYYGKSNEHWHFPGTVTLSAQTLMAVLREVGESLYRAGFRKLALLNSHGGQPQVMEIVARDLHQTHRDFLIFPLFAWNVPHQAGELLNEQEKALGIHAGDAETSLMLAVLPDQVRMDRAVAEYPPKIEGLLSIEGKLPFAWTTQDLSCSGVLGDPTGATQEKGQRMLNSIVDGWIKVIKEIYQFQLPRASGVITDTTQVRL